MKLPFKPASGFQILEAYANDAAFLAATNAPLTSGLMYRATTGRYRTYNGGLAAWRNVGDVVGPASNTANFLPFMSGTSGDTIAQSQLNTGASNDSLLFAADGVGTIGLPAASRPSTISALAGIYVGLTGAPDATAIVQLDSTTQGFLKPRLTTTQRDAIVSPPAGLEIYNTTTGKPEYFGPSLTWVSPNVQGPGSSEIAAIATWADTGGSQLSSSLLYIGGAVLRGQDNSIADASAAGPASVRGGNKTAGTGVGGNLTLSGGTSSGGTAGSVLLQTGGVTRATLGPTGVMTLDTSLLWSGTVKLKDAGSNFIGLVAPSSVSASYTITLPAAAPGANTFLKYNGSDYVWLGATGFNAWPNSFVDPGGSGDFTTLSAALAALPADGGVICIIGSITISSAINVTSNNVQITSRSKNVTVTMAAGGSLTFSGTACQMRDVSMTSNTTAITYVTVTGNDFKMSNCLFDSATNADGNTYVAFQANGSDHYACEFRKTIAPANNTGFSYASGTSENTYTAPKFT